MFSARADSIGLRALAALLSLALFCALSVAAPAADLNQALASAMKGTKTPALSLLVMHGGKIAQVAVRGVRRNDGHDPVRIDDV